MVWPGDGLVATITTPAMHPLRYPLERIREQIVGQGLRGLSARHKILGFKARFLGPSVGIVKGTIGSHDFAKIMHHTAPNRHTSKGRERPGQGQPRDHEGHEGHTKVGGHVGTSLDEPAPHQVPQSKTVCGAAPPQPPPELQGDGAIDSPWSTLHFGALTGMGAKGCP